jgi:clan AA aspartic protease
MGRVMTRVELFNIVDELNAAAGLIPADRVRRQVVEALVDTGAVHLALPADVVATLGLVEIDRRQFRLADGTLRELPIAGALHIAILGRTLECSAVVLPAGSTPLIGQIPLEGMDLVVDPRSREVTVNPASPDYPILDLLSVA